MHKNIKFHQTSYLFHNTTTAWTLFILQARHYYNIKMTYKPYEIFIFVLPFSPHPNPFVQKHILHHTWRRHKKVHTRSRQTSLMSQICKYTLPLLHCIHFPGSTYAAIYAVIGNASTSLGRSLASMILNPVELPFWVSCSSFACPKAQPTGIPSIYALQACKIYLLRRLKCSSTSASKCCTSVNQPKVLCRSAK